MKKICQYAYFFIILFAAGALSAQEGLTDLHGNLQYLYGDLSPVDRQPNAPDIKSRPANNNYLPFYDDFFYASTSLYPDPVKWSDKQAFINTGYPIAPPSIGVATFDGLNEHGYPYTNPTVPNLSINGPADTLTSLPINLFISASQQTLTLNDSIGLSFYYQARGYGEAPEAIDSLIMDFYKPRQDKWQSRVWFSRGNTNSNTIDTAFKRAFVMIADTAYLSDSFKFRIRNKATNSGNFDHWHVDYVYLNSGRSRIGDTLYNDVAFATVPSSFLRDYNAMPYEQYQTGDMASKNWVKIKNNYKDPINIFYENQFFDPLGTQIYTYSAQADNILPFKSSGYFNKTAFSSPASHPTFTFNYPYPMLDSGDFKIRHVIYRSGANNDFFPRNDTVYQFQRFRNYYAIDDGQPEAGYYVLGAGGQMLVKITVNVTDTLRAVRIYFDPAPIASANKYYFKLRIFSELNGGVGPGYYLPDTQYFPRFYDSTGFKRIPEYQLPTPIVLAPGVYYIGIQQQLSTGLVVGWDKSTIADGSIYYNSGSGWNQSSIRGALMIRPVFGKKVPPPVGINENAPRDEQINFYPNPASSELYVSGENITGANYFLVNSLGQIVKTGILVSSHDQISTGDLSTGLYVIRLSRNNQFIRQQKILIQN